MAASDEFPRGGTATTRAVGVLGSITIPGVAGVAHVLTSIDAWLAALVAGNLDVVVGVTGFYDLATNGPLLETNIQSTANYIAASWTGSVILPAGTALTVAFNAASANFIEALVIAWYDI